MPMLMITEAIPMLMTGNTEVDDRANTNADCQPQGANFEDPAGSRANLEGVNLKGANLEGSIMAGGMGVPPLPKFAKVWPFMICFCISCNVFRKV